MRSLGIDSGVFLRADRGKSKSEGEKVSNLHRGNPGEGVR